MVFGSCRAGHSDWVSTTNGACFVSAHDYTFESCLCPISTCVGDGNGSYSCVFTPLSNTIMVMAGVLLVVLVVSYWVLMRVWGREDGHSIETSVEAFWAYTDKMFGVYHANAEDDEEMAHAGGGAMRASSKPREERRPLVEAKAGPEGGGGTFN